MLRRLWRWITKAEARERHERMMARERRVWTAYAECAELLARDPIDWPRFRAAQARMIDTAGLGDDHAR